MPRKIPGLVWLALPMAYVLYFYQIAAVGLIGPDEPRYASIGREMAQSWDWITPRLWGQPWFEKPALLYWMQAAAFRLGLGNDLAPRLPVGLVSVAFLVFYWWILRREFQARVAWFAVSILGTCGMWIGFSQVGVTDLPLTATFSAAMFLALPWIAKRDTRYLPWVAALLGLAVLAKGLVPLVLALPLAMRRGALRDLLRPRVTAPFLLIAAPWYVLCYARNGNAFWEEFFVRHHFSRFASNALMHVQPWWFYLPVMLGGLLPWFPLAGMLARRAGWRDPRRRFLLLWLIFGLVFFSAAANKLPGYVMPLFPAMAALVALSLDEAERAGAWLAACALLLAVFAIAAPMLTVALDAGLSRAPRPSVEWTWLLPAVLAAAVWILDRRAHRLAAVVCIAAGSAAGTLYLKARALPEVERTTSARTLWHEVAPHAKETCVDGLGRDWRYGLNYYSVTPFPDCSAERRRFVLRQRDGKRPYLTSEFTVPVGASRE